MLLLFIQLLFMVVESVGRISICITTIYNHEFQLQGCTEDEERTRWGVSSSLQLYTPPE